MKLELARIYVKEMLDGGAAVCTSLLLRKIRARQRKLPYLSSIKTEYASSQLSSHDPCVTSSVFLPEPLNFFPFHPARRVEWQAFQ